MRVLGWLWVNLYSLEPPTNFILFSLLTSSLSSRSNCLVEPCSATSFKPSLAGSPYVQKRYSVVCEAPITSLNFVNHPFEGKSFGCVWRDQSPSNVSSYLASSHALHSSSMSGWASPELASFSHKVLLKEPSSLYQMSLCSITVDLNVMQPLPALGAVHVTFFYNEKMDFNSNSANIRK